jgi:DNA-binding transcriptional MerR regulator
MAARNYQSIGEVLVSLKTEFPDITISKIRFLESEGLIAPERTPSGYRKFYEQDIERLRSILRLQRDEYLPLKVIKDRLLQEDVDGPTLETEEVQIEEVDELAEPVSGLRMTLDEMSSSTGVEKEQILELEKVGILCSHGSETDLYYDGDDYLLLSIVKDLLRHGFEPRHLTKYRRFEEDEAFFFQSIVDPLRKQRNPDARRAAEETLQDLARLSRRLKQALLSIRLREYMAS